MAAESTLSKLVTVGVEKRFLGEEEQIVTPARFSNNFFLQDKFLSGN